MHTLDNAIIMLMPVLSIIGLFTFLSVWVWSRQRRREREAYYRYELGRQLAEKGTADERVLELLAGQGGESWRSRREGLKLAALLCLGLGIGALAGLRFIEDEQIWLVGWIPLAVGVALLIYAVVMAPKNGGADVHRDG